MEKSLIPLAALAATGLVAPTVAEAASPTASANGRVVLLAPLAFLNVEDLLFGSAVVPASGSGTIAINPLGAAPVYTNVDPLPSSNPRRGWLLGAGEPGETVTITASLPTKLYLNGDNTNPSIPVSMIFDHLQYPDGHWEYTANSSKTYNIYVGGTLTIPAGTASGTYSNQFTVTATYP